MALLQDELEGQQRNWLQKQHELILQADEVEAKSAALQKINDQLRVFDVKKVLVFPLKISSGMGTRFPGLAHVIFYRLW